MKTLESVATEGANGTSRTSSGFALLNENAPFVEELYQRYLANPETVDEEWRDYFARLTNGPVSAQPGARVGGCTPTVDIERHARVLQLIDAYRERGHLQATLDPLGIMPKRSHPELEA